MINLKEPRDTGGVKRGRECQNRNGREGKV